MSWLDYLVLVSTVVAIAVYGYWRTRRDRDLGHYLHGDERAIRWGTIGLSVMATQASAITFLSTPGQAFESGMGFVQNYFGLPFALIIVCAIFIPIYHRLKVVTAYEYLGQRFDQKTRLLGASLFLLQRGFAAGITIYAPAIIISAILGWNLQVTILLSGIFVIIYTAAGGTTAVSITQKWQMAVILAGMFVAFGMIVHRLSPHVSLGGALGIAATMGKLNVVDFSFDLKQRYTFWSGLLGGFFLALSYFGTDQSQVQRYLAGGNSSGSRFGLLFNAVLKIPMQFFILLMGVMVFVFYQFEKPPLFFNQPAFAQAQATDTTGRLAALQTRFDEAAGRQQEATRALAEAQRSSPADVIATARESAVAGQAELQRIRTEAKATLQQLDATLETKDSDYVFITWVLTYLPHGVIGLLVAVIFCAAMSSTAAELNALGSTSEVDFYRPLIRKEASEAHYLFVAKLLTTCWGIVAIAFALFANLVENLIEAVNILGSIFYGPILGLFLTAFFLRRVGGSAAFTATVVAQIIVIIVFNTVQVSYLWLNPVGCSAVLLLAPLLQRIVFARRTAE